MPKFTRSQPPNPLDFGVHSASPNSIHYSPQVHLWHDLIIIFRHASNSSQHQEDVFWSLEASRSVWEDVECKLRCVNFRRVSDHRRAFWLAFRVTGIPDDWYRSTMGVIVITLETPWSAGENFGCTWEHVGAPGSAGDQPRSADDKSGGAGDKSGSTSTQCTAVLETQHLWERCWRTWKS